MARPRKPVAALKLSGQYRKDRHGQRADDTIGRGKPRRPKWIADDPAAKWLWSAIVNGMVPGVLCSADVPLLSVTCRWWSVWQALGEKLAADPTNYKLCVSLAAASKNLLACFAKLGLSPVDRTRLTVPTPRDPGDELEEFAGKGRFFKTTDLIRLG